MFLHHPRQLAVVALSGGGTFSNSMQFCSLAVPHVHSGDTVLFWADKWHIDNRVIALQTRFPHLYSFVLNDLITVKDFFLASTEAQNFHLPLSIDAYQELQQL